MHATRVRCALLSALLIAAPASAQWRVYYQGPGTSGWTPASGEMRSRELATNQARRYCLVPRVGGVPPATIVKIVDPGQDPAGATVIPCQTLGAPRVDNVPASGANTPRPSTGVPVSVPVINPVSAAFGVPSLQELKRNPVEAIRKLAGSLPANSAPSLRPTATQVSGSSALDVVGVRLGMSPAAADKAVRAHMPVGWVYVRDRSRIPRPANTYESMMGYVATDLSEVVLAYFEPSMTRGTLVAVRRVSMLGKSVDPGVLEATLVQKYGRPAHEGKHSWAWGRPAGCSATGVGSLKVQDLDFIEGQARSDQTFKQVIASALDLATYDGPVKRAYYDACGPVLQVLRTATNGVMTTLVDQKFTMDHLAAERYDDAAIKF